MKNEEHFEKPNTEAKSKFEERGECFPYNVKQIQNKFKRCFKQFRQTAMKVNIASGIKPEL